MKKNYLSSLLLVSLLAVSTPIFASAWYVGGQLGFGKTNWSVGEFRNHFPSLFSAKIDTSGGLAGGLLLGYQYSEEWSGELGWLDLKNTQFTDVVFNYPGTITPLRPQLPGYEKITAWDFLIKYTYILDNGVGIFGKAGGAYEHAFGKGSMAAFGSTNKLAPLLGIGFNYAFNPNVVVDVAYTNIFSSGNVPNSELLLFGIYYYWI
jgi:opacity protein-like surface antigen